MFQHDQRTFELVVVLAVVLREEHSLHITAPRGEQLLLYTANW